MKTPWSSEEKEGWRDPVQAGRGKWGNPHQKEEIRRPRPRGLWGERKEKIQPRQRKAI